MTNVPFHPSPRQTRQVAHRRGNRRIGRWFGLLLSALVLLTQGFMLPASSAVSAQSSNLTDRAGDARHRILVVLQSDSAPAPGGVANLTFQATPLLDAPDLRIEWLLPQGGELLGGPAEESLGPVAASQTVQLERQVRFPQAGIYSVMALAGYQPAADTQFSAVGVLFFTVDANGRSLVSDKDPTAVSPHRTLMETQVVHHETFGTTSTNGDPCFTINGNVSRIERPPLRNGYGANLTVPVRYAKVEMREEDTLFDDSYGESLTDANGNYSFSFCDDDGIFDDELELYVRLRAELMMPDGREVVEVEDSSWIDEVYEYDSAVIDSEGGTLTINFSLDLNQSGVFNVADAVYEAWKVWNDAGGAVGDDAIFDYQAEVHWEPGYGDSGSYYNSFWNEITIADDPSDPDQWDDSVIMHEWGHMADDKYGCDDNSGGPHYVDTLVDDPELAWGEGYPDYYQSAVRSLTGHPDPSFYLDMNGAGTPGISVDLETYDATRSANLLSERNELAIAAMLWDLFDSNNEPRLVGGTPMPPTDRVSLGHGVIQEVYTDPFFESNGDLFDDTCTSFVYLWSWLKLNKPTDPATAETVQKNIGRANPFFGGNPRLTAGDNPSDDASQEIALSAARSANSTSYRPEDFRWWRQLTMVVDRSPSMGDNGKLDAVKTLMNEQVNDIVAPDPKGVEVSLYTFDNTSAGLNTVLEGFFFPDGITPGINSLAPLSGLDPGCQVNALQALAQAVENKRGGQAWVYTDGDTYAIPSLPAMRQLLSARQVRASFALLGGCGSPARTSADVSGEEQTYLQLAADGSQPSGIVPYLLTALGSGGQFLFVNPDQLGNAADILRAQLSNSAGAGRWSDYVSDSFTYRWDRLLPWEYQWFPAESLGQDAGQLYSNQLLRVDLPLPFPFYGGTTSTVGVSEDGIIRMNPCFASPLICAGLLYREYLDILDTDMTWTYVYPPPRAAPADAAQPAQDGPQVNVYTAGLGIDEWYIISTQGTADYGSGGVAPRAYQVWLNFQTGEIRFLYHLVRNEAATAEIGLQRSFELPTPHDEKLLVSDHDVNGASNDMGYKFIPAPPQPTKTYAVEVDPLIESVGFLMTGYSGDFEPLSVTYPDGSPVDCNDVANVLCLTLDSQPNDRMVQYVQVNVNDRTGTWHATVDAGPSGQATFTFTALATSELRAESPSERLIASVGSTPLLVNLGRAVDGGTLTGWLQQPNGARFGDEFTFYDDGTHGDSLPGDGIFAQPDFTPPGAGAGYLWVRGSIDGAEFVRSDPMPFNFQPFRLTVQESEVANDNQPHALHVTLENLDTVAHCYNPDVQVPDTWTYAWDFPLGCLEVDALGSRTQILTIYPTWYHAASGEKAQVVVSFTESELGAISDSAAVTFSRHRAPFFIEFDNRSQHTYLRPNGSDSVPLTIIVTDEQGVNVADGTPLSVSTSLGSVTPTSGTTRAGRLTVTFTAGTSAGDALVTAQTGSLSATTTVHIAAALPAQIELVATPSDLSDDANTASVIATVRDPWGEPLAGQMVRIGVNGDGESGTLDGGVEVITGTTDAQGQMRVTFTKASSAAGVAILRAELLVLENGVPRAVHEARMEILVSMPKVYLPLVTR
jgi:hypothetical protein